MANGRVEHKDFTVADEQIIEYSKYCEVVGKTKSFWGKYCTPDSQKVGDKLIIRRQILQDPASVASLNEGETPREDSIKLVTFDVDTNSYGSYIKYSRQAFLNNRDSVLDQGNKQLAHSRLYDIESVRSAAFVGTPNSIVKAATWKETLENANTVLFKNGAMEDNGFYDLICTPEHANQIKAEAGRDFNGTPTAEDIAKTGLVGYWEGFRIIRCKDPVMYTTENANGLVFYFGKTDDGKFPVISRGADEANIEVISHEIGSMGAADPTNETGTIASRIDDIAAELERPELLFKTETALKYVAPTVPGDYKPNLGTTGEVTSPAV